MEIKDKAAESGNLDSGGPDLSRSDQTRLDQGKGGRSILTSVYTHRWIPITFGSVCAYSTMITLVSTLGDEVDATVVTFWRTSITTCLALIVALYNGNAMKITTVKEMKFHIVHGSLLIISIYLQFYAYQHMAAADAAAIIYSYVAFTGIFARLILKEAFGFFEIAMVIMTFVGVVLVARPTFLLRNSAGTISGKDPGIIPPLVAFVASLANALYVVTVRAMGITEMKVMKALFYGMLFTCICLMIPIFISGHPIVPLCIWGRLRLFAMGLCAFLGIGLMNYALSIENAVYVSLVSIDDVFVVLIISIVFLGFQPKWTSIVGIILIMGSSIVILARKVLAYRMMKDAKEEQSCLDISVIS